MERVKVLENTSEEEMAQAVEFAKIRLQQQKDSPNLPDPEDSGTFDVPRKTPVTPAIVQQSVDTLVRNEALKAIKAKNTVDEKDAKANIEEAKEKSFETKETPKAKTTKSK